MLTEDPLYTYSDTANFATTLRCFSHRRVKREDAIKQ